MTIDGALRRPQVIAAYVAIWVFWGSSYLAIRYAVETLPPFLFSSVRYLIAGGLLYAVARLRGAAAPTRAQWGQAAIMGALFLLLGNGLVVWSEQRITSGIAAMVCTTEPLWIVLIDSGRLARRPSLRTFIGLIAGFIGVALLVRPFGDGAIQTVDPWSALAALLGTVAWAAGAVYTAALEPSTRPRSPAIASGAQMLAGGALLLATSVVRGEPERFSIHGASTTSIVAFAYLVIGCSLIAFMAYDWLLRHEPSSRVATHAFINPVIAVAIGCTIGQEQLTLSTLIASLVIVASVVLIVIGERDHEAQPVGESPAAT